LNNSDEALIPAIDKVNKTASGGNKKSQVAGYRFALRTRHRVTPTKLKAIFDLLTNQASTYFYTPEQTYDLYAGIITPIPVTIDGLASNWDNRKFHYIKFNVTGISYI